MDEPTAVVDKSLFELICLQKDVPPDCYFGHLGSRYQLIVPPILVEEIIVNLVEPQGRAPAVVDEMVTQVLKLRPNWMEDIIEMAFKELVLKQSLEKFPAPADAHIKKLEQLLRLGKNDPELLNWVHRRPAEKKDTITQRKEGQDKLIPPGTRLRLSSELSFFHHTVQKELLPKLCNAAERTEMLEIILGERFRKIHPDFSNEVAGQFQSLDADKIKNYPITLKCLLTRLIYVLAPCMEIYSPGAGTEPREILDRKSKNQRNNLEDEEYVASALLCGRLLTADRGMKNIAQVFRAGGFWMGEVIWIDPRQALADQIPLLLV